MTQNEIIDKITEAAESVGWNVTASENGEGSVEVNFNTDTRFCQDLNCWGTLKGSDYRSLANEIQNWYEGYDPEEEAMLWLDSDGHGKNGAPYHMRDVLADMEDADSRLEDLAIALRQININ